MWMTTMKTMMQTIMMMIAALLAAGRQTWAKEVVWEVQIQAPLISRKRLKALAF